MELLVCPEAMLMLLSSFEFMLFLVLLSVRVMVGVAVDVHWACHVFWLFDLVNDPVVMLMANS